MTNPPQKLPMHTPDLTDIEKMTGETRDLVADNIAQLKALFPEVMTDGKINFDTLQELLGAEVEKNEEHYNFTWHGKRAALRLAQTPSLGTLRPVKDESPDWDNTQNVFIEGDNLEVLKLLQKSYFGKVKMIYIDPPYNTGNDFVYEDDFKDGVTHYLEMTGQIDEEGVRASTNASSHGRYHTNWLNMMYPRLRLARNLMRDDGVIFISIDDNEQANLKKLCDEVFGEENFVASIIWNKKNVVQNDAKYMSTNHEYLICYGKNNAKLDFYLLPRTQEQLDRYKNPDNDPRGPWTSVALQAKSGSSTYEIQFPNGATWKPVSGTYPRLNKENLMKAYDDGRLWFGANGTNVPRLKKYLNEVADGAKSNSLWLNSEVGSTQLAKETLKKLLKNNVFETPKPTELIEKCLKLTTKDNDIILDFFAGSGTTADSVMQLNAKDGGARKFICVQIPEACNEKSEAHKAGYKNIADISKERIRRAAQKIKDAGGLAHTPDLGFKVFRLDTSNLKRWDSSITSVEEVEVRLTDAVDYIKHDRSPEDDLLFELLLKYGLDLAVPIETRKVGNKQIYSIGEGKLVVCLDTDITTEVAEAIALLNEEDPPEGGMRVVFLDAGFKDDCAKTNSIITLKSRGITDVKSL